jgi:signal transduction histidine kinase
MQPFKPKRQRKQLSLPLSVRLFALGCLTLMIGIGSAAAIPYLYKSREFTSELSEKVAKCPDKCPEDEYVAAVDVFHTLNTQSAILTLAWGFICTAALSFWMAMVISVPLEVMIESLQRFSAGDRNVRVPPSELPELHRLGLTLNSVANRLQIAEERQREFLQNIRHEMSTPLTVIAGYHELIQFNKIELTPQIAQDLCDETYRLKRLLDDLKTISEVEAVPLVLQVVPPHDLIDRVVSLLSVQKSPSCDLVTDYPRPIPAIFVDPDRTQQILMNLISNALAYTLEGSITIRAWTCSSDLWIEIVDTGIGIAPDQIERVFDRCWRSQRSRELRSNGSGIGLSLTKSLIEIQGGRIEVESELGNGSTFRFCLPLANWQKIETKAISS